MRTFNRIFRLLVGCILFCCSLLGARGEGMLQYFNTEYREIMRRIPELAEVGYTSLWLPPPCKGSGGFSVGYDLWDRFDLGSKNQRGTVRTLYGTEAELLELVALAHRFGIRVYFDNIMNHNAFDIPGYNETTPIDVYPGFVPEDFHLRKTKDGFYRKWDNTRDWNSAWQVQNLGLSDLIDIAHETPNTNHGFNEGDDMPKLTFTRHPNNPEYYVDTDLPQALSGGGVNVTVYPFANKEPFQDVGVAGNGAGNGRFDWTDLNGNGQHDVGEPSEPFTDTGVDPLTPGRNTAAWGFGDGKYNMGNPVPEDVNAMLIRTLRWQTDRTKADGYRLDAVKHVPDYFFGQQGGANKDSSNAGYLGGAQEQFNLVRGYSDWNNHRDTVFDTEQPRDDLMLFGEHLGSPPGFDGYINAGMRLIDNPLRNELNNRLGNPGVGLNGYDQPGAGGFSPGVGVTHAQSHDSDFAARRELQHAYYFTRAGLPLIYTDGYNKAGLLEGSGGAFPRHSNTNFLGQFGDPKIPNVVYVHEHFSRGDQVGRWSDADYVAYERIDKRENGSMSDADGVTLLFMMNDNFSSGQARGIASAFPGSAYLYNYSTYNGGFYVNASSLGSVIVPPGGYFMFSYRSPETSTISNTGPLTILQNGVPAGTVTVERKDGRNGDKGFNPYGLPDANTTDYKYSISLPRVTSGTNLSFIARTDGSAENILMKLDGGVDINSQMGIGPTTGDKRDNKPALSTDVFNGYEQMQFVRRSTEKFAAKDTARNVIGSPGAETWRFTVGTVGFTRANGSGTNTSSGTATYVYHDPEANRDIGGAQFSPQPALAAGQPITIKVKTGYQFQVDNLRLYYTTDGSAPEGSGGEPAGTTQVVVMSYQEAGNPDGSNVTDWWTGNIPAQTAGTVIRYKVGAFKSNGASVFPSSATTVDVKRKMETVFQITNFNATTATVRPHNDYSEQRTGLEEGWHVLRARAFLSRSGKASIYNTFTQTFYYDTQTPQGAVVFPSQNETLGGGTYGAVVRAASDVTEVWYNITDGDPSNDDGVTGSQGGNGAGPEPFTDSNGNGVRDSGESFTDINGNGTFDGNLAATWQRASEVTPSLTTSSPYPREFRFNYRNIPATGTATIKVRLLELSSSRNMTLSPAASWTTELVRTVNTAGPNLRMFVAFPQQDGQVTGDGYVMKVRFTNTLGDGLSESELRSRISVKIASEVSGESQGAVTQVPQTLPIIYNASPGYHDFQFALPNLYNGNPDFLHLIEVTMTRPGNSSLVATRLVKAFPVLPPPLISIINPPEFDSDGKRYEIILPDVPVPTPEQRQFVVEVDTDDAYIGVQMVFTKGAGTMALINDGTPNPRIEGDHKFWRFLWSGITEGQFTFEARGDLDGNAATVEGRDIRNATVLFRQIVPPNPTDTDDDDDGLSDSGEQTLTALPATDPNTWTNGQVHVHFAFGQTDPTIVDTDGDGLSDGLEVGWASASDAGTNTATDTNGDGFLNFQADLDSPLFNVTGNSTRPGGFELFSPWSYNANNNRTDLIAGTSTNPNKADTDDDGLNDGVEDANRNGRVDIGTVDGTGSITALIAHPPTFYNTSRLDRSKLPAGAVVLETDPASGDTDGDGLKDGSEDVDDSGGVSLVLVDLDAADVAGDFVVLGPFDESNALGYGRFSDITWSFGSYKSKRVSLAKVAAQFPKTNAANGHRIGLLFSETDACSGDTDGDGLSDGWESANGLDPLDAGTGTSLRTGRPGLASNGPAGDPDNDGFTNLQEFVNGTDPRQPDTGVPPPPNSIVIGPQTPVVIGGVSNSKEFTDWTADDLIVLDEVDGEGTNTGGGDIYHNADGGDSSRDIVAFYAHDGGATGAGGDGNFYFRVDVADLVPFAEDGKLDIYVVLNVGNPGIGERNLPDDVDTYTTMGWQAVVACYSGNNGRVYIDTNPTTNTTGLGQSLAGAGVIQRDQSSANGFKKSYYNSELDSVEFSISRQALLDAGWNGLNAADLLFQVFTTKDGTTNSPVGPGDLGGRTDIRDTIYDDYLANDYYGAQAAISGNGSKLQAYFGRTAGNDRGRSAKILSVIHGNQAIQPGSSIQALINTANGAGYYRPLDVHQAYGVPVAMHITPTLASAIQWAKVDPASPRQYRDGPAFNSRIRNLAGSGVVQLLGSTFSDHIIDYFPADFNASNVSLANEYLTSIYGPGVSTQVFWNPERVADTDVFQKIAALGFGWTFIDQQRHVFKWFGRESSLSNDGYRINEMNGVKSFVINDNLGVILFTNDDNGLPISLRNLLLRKARSSSQDQVIVIVNNWEDFAINDNADDYDRNMRWLACHPWTKITTPQEIAAGQIDLNVPPDGNGNTWGTVNRGANIGLPKVQHDFLDHATQESYDNWYNGQAGREEGLRDKRFNVRPSVQLPAAKKWGTVGIDGVSHETWATLNTISSLSSPMGRLARGTAFSSVFQTAFHNQTNDDRSKFSTGAYIYPDTTSQTLASFAAVSQAQFRNAAIYKRIDTWVQGAAAGSFNGTVATDTFDADLDGESEYLIYNDRLCALFERIGGRLTGLWARDPATGSVVQTIGNFASYAGLADEREGLSNIVGGAVDAYRVTAMRDQFFTPTTGPGTNQYVNDLYSIVAAPSGAGWQITSSDGKIRKTVTLAVGATALSVNHSIVGGGGPLFVRFGLSPNLGDLLLNGQANLLGTPNSNPVSYQLYNRNSALPSRVSIVPIGTNFPRNVSAVDRDSGVAFDTINMRNLAQTVQVEFQLTGGGIQYEIGSQVGSTISGDSDGDGLPDLWEVQNGIDPFLTSGANGAGGDPDNDGLTNSQEYAFSSNPLAADNAIARITVTRPTASTTAVTFASRAGRAYRVEYTNDLLQPWTQAGPNIAGTGGNITWTDDGTQTVTAPGLEVQRFYRVVAIAP